KALPVVSSLYDRLADFRADRKTLVVAVGGGVIGDLAGFAAATFNRGLPLLMVPTSLLAVVGSSGGGQGGCIRQRGQDPIGALHQPAGVWIDTSFLDTLPEREYHSGLAEVVKYGVILDDDLFTYLERQREPLLRRAGSVVEYVIMRCCQLKAGVVEQ